MKKYLLVIAASVSTLLFLFFCFMPFGMPEGFLDDLQHKLRAEEPEMVHLTLCENEPIIGICASSSFQVELVKSNRPRAVVDIAAELEPYLRFSRSDDGVVTVGINEKRTYRRIMTFSWNDTKITVGRGERRESKRLFRIRQRSPRKLTLYLPEIHSVRLSDACRLSASEPFIGDNVTISISDYSDIEKLDISCSDCRVECTGSSRALLALSASGDLTVAASGSAMVDLTVTRVAGSNVTTSNRSVVHIEGTGGSGEWAASGRSRILAGGFTLEELTVRAMNRATVRANVSGEDRQAIATTHSNVTASNRSVVYIDGACGAG